MIKGICKAQELKKALTKAWLLSTIPLPKLESKDFGGANAN